MYRPVLVETREYPKLLAVTTEILKLKTFTPPTSNSKISIRTIILSQRQVLTRMSQLYATKNSNGVSFRRSSLLDDYSRASGYCLCWWDRNAFFAKNSPLLSYNTGSRSRTRQPSLSLASVACRMCSTETLYWRKYYIKSTTFSAFSLLHKPPTFGLLN